MVRNGGWRPGTLKDGECKATENRLEQNDKCKKINWLQKIF
jgi:hypothetical protein